MTFIKFIGGVKPSPSSNLVGLDIGPDYLKILKINNTKKPFLVENYAILPLPLGVMAKDEIKDYTMMGGAIKDLFWRAGVSTKEVALAIPRSIAIIKNITVDARLSADEVESRAWIEANRSFPDLIGNIYLDFAVVGPSVQDASQLELVLVACRKDQINSYLEVLRIAGLVPRVVDVNSFALERALQFSKESSASGDAVALLNLDMNLSTFIVTQGKNLVHAHDQSFDGHRLANQTKNYMKEGEAAVDDVGYSNILKENLLSHLRHTVHFFYSSRPNISVQKIILSGDCAAISGVCGFVQNEIGVETMLANPFRQMILAPHVKVQEINQHAAALMLCCGLAFSQVEPI